MLYLFYAKSQSRQTNIISHFLFQFIDFNVAFDTKWRSAIWKML